ncbi:hypothetical protein [Bdellovibrio sp. BCCA]|uniref:hypothetical protein n=1 Tax=Bdellovibrio sp. BCCA TaxID=3136281 RepID=UPI0030F183E2
MKNHYDFVTGEEYGELPLLGAINLAVETYRGEHVFSHSKHIEIFKANPNSFFFAMDTLTKKVVGCIVAIPVKDDFFNRTISPDFNEDELSKDVIASSKSPGVRKLYFCSITCDQKSSDRVRILSGLMRKFISFYGERLLEGCKVTEVSAMAVSAAGAHLCEMMGLTKISEHQDGHSVYKLSNLSKKIYDNHLTNVQKNVVLRDVIRRTRTGAA